MSNKREPQYFLRTKAGPFKEELLKESKETLMSEPDFLPPTVTFETLLETLEIELNLVEAAAGKIKDTVNALFGDEEFLCSPAEPSPTEPVQSGYIPSLQEKLSRLIRAREELQKLVTKLETL